MFMFALLLPVCPCSSAVLVCVCLYAVLYTSRPLEPENSVTNYGPWHSFRMPSTLRVSRSSTPSIQGKAYRYSRLIVPNRYRTFCASTGNKGNPNPFAHCFPSFAIVKSRVAVRSRTFEFRFYSRSFALSLSQTCLFPLIRLGPHKFVLARQVQRIFRWNWF